MTPEEIAAEEAAAKAKEEGAHILVEMRLKFNITLTTRLSTTPLPTEVILTAAVYARVLNFEICLFCEHMLLLSNHQ